jgi:hypothetical protein
MMAKKFAVFVEGFTEQEFTIKLLTELAGKHGISFEVYFQNNGKLHFSELRSHQSPIIYVLIANCCNDGQVKSQIKDQYNSLKAAGYSLIVGLRDVYPFTHTEISQLEKNLLVGLPLGSLPIHLHLAIMEIEAWFIEEATHFSRIDSNINATNLLSGGFDISNMRAYDLPHPAETLRKIYNTVGKGYTKNRRQVQRTIDAISYEELYVNTRKKAPSLEQFITSLELGLFPAS